MRPFSCWVWALNALQNSMMFTPCWPSAGPTGGAGLACPPGICSLMSVRTFLAMSVQFLHLVEGQLHRNLALEDIHEDLELLLVGVDVDDLAVEVGERPGGYLHRLAERELDLGARSVAIAAAGMQDPVDLRLGQGHGLRAGADETGHTGGVLHNRPGLVGHVHVDEDVAREHALLGLDLLALLRLDHLLGRDDDPAELRRLVHGHDPVLEIGLHLVLVARVRVDDVPLEHQTKTSWTSRLKTRSHVYKKMPTITQAISTTTTPWISCAWVGHSTFLSSAIDSPMKPRTPPPRAALGSRAGSGRAASRAVGLGGGAGGPPGSAASLPGVICALRARRCARVWRAI